MSVTQDQTLQVRGFIVEIDGGGSGTEPDSAWRRVSGGAETVEVRKTTTGPDQIQMTAPGAAYITSIELEGPMTATRKAMYLWIDATNKGQDPRRKVTIKPVDANGQPVKTFVYDNCLIEEYRMPSLSAESHDLLEEYVRIKPERLEIV